MGAPPRVLNKTKLFPVVYTLDKGELSQKRALGDVYFKRVMEPEDVERVRSVLEEVGAQAYSEARAQAIAQEAMGFLEQANLGLEERGRWEAIAAWLAGSSS